MGWAAVAGLGAAAIWGGMYVASKYVLDFIPPLTLVALRLAIASAVFGVVLRAGKRARPSLSDLRQIALCGAVGYGISITAQFVGTRWSTAHDGALITSATPAFIALFARPLLGERVTRRRWIALVVATLGVVIVAGGGGQDGAAGEWRLLGNALLAFAALTWSLYTVLGKRVSARAGALAVTAYATPAGLVCVLPFAVGEQLLGVGGVTSAGPTDWSAIPGLAWAGVFYLGVVATAVAFYLWNKTFETLDASVASLFFFAQPVVGAALGWLLLGERLQANFYAGAAAIVAGVLLTLEWPARTGRRSFDRAAEDGAGGGR